MNPYDHKETNIGNRTPDTFEEALRQSENFSEYQAIVTNKVDPSLLPLKQSDPFLANRNTESNRDEQASPSFSQGANKESNYITFAGPHVNTHGSFKKFLISNSAQRQLEAYNLANKIIKETKYISDQKDIVDPPNSESSNRNLNNDSSVPSMYSITFGAKGNEKIVQSLQKGSKNSSTKQSPEKTSDFKRISPTKKINSSSKRDRSSSSPSKKFEGTQSARQSIAKKHTKRDGSWEVSVKGVYDVEMKKDLSKGDLMTLPFYAPDVSNVTTSEIFLNISTLTANNDKKMLLNKSFEINSSRSNSVHLGINNGEVVETQAQEVEEKIVATPVPYIRKKNKESPSKVSGEILSAQTSHREHKEENEFQNFNSFQEIKNKIRDRVMSEKRNQSLSAEDSLVSSARKARDTQNDNVEKQPAQDGNVLQENTENLVQEEVRKLSFSIDNPLPKKLVESPERIQVDPCPSKRDDLTPERLEEEEGLDDGFTDQLARLGSQKYRDQLQESMNKINIRTIMMLKNIIKPNENILMTCQAFVQLFAGLNEAIPASFSFINQIEWSNIKVLLNSPLKIINLIASFPSFVENKQVPQRNIHSSLTSLAKIPYEVTSNPQNEAFYQLYEFIVAAIEYQKYFKPQIFEMHCETEKETTIEINQDFSPLKEQTDRNATKEQYNIANSTQESHRVIRTRTSTSPLGDILSSQETTRTHGNKNMNKSFERTKKGQYEPMLETKVRDFNTKASRSNMKYLINERQYTQDEEQETSPEYIAMRAHTVEAEWREISMLDDTIERRSREAREYKSKAQRLLADHERYVKRLLKAREEADEELHREIKLEERAQLAAYLAHKQHVEKKYIQELAIESANAKRESKVKQERAEQENLSDELRENLREHCFIVTQNERRKYEKKKQLWGQYKEKMAEKLVKKKKEVEEATSLKQEISKKRIESYQWKKKQATQSRNEWRDQYYLLSNLIGNAK